MNAALQIVNNDQEVTLPKRKPSRTRAKVIALFKAHPHGLTTDAARALLPEIHQQTVTTAINILVKKWGYLVDSGRREPTRAMQVGHGGRLATVYTYTETPKPLAPARVTKKKVEAEWPKTKASVVKLVRAMPVEQGLQEIVELASALLAGRSRYQVANAVLDVALKCNTPALFISQRSHVRDQAAGLETGMSFGMILPDSTPKPKKGN